MFKSNLLLWKSIPLRFELTFDLRITPTTDLVEFENTIRLVVIIGWYCGCLQDVDGGSRIRAGDGVCEEDDRPEYDIHRSTPYPVYYITTAPQSQPMTTPGSVLSRQPSPSTICR